MPLAPSSFLLLVRPAPGHQVRTLRELLVIVASPVFGRGTAVGRGLVQIQTLEHQGNVLPTTESVGERSFFRLLS